MLAEGRGCCWCSPSDRKGERTGCCWCSPSDSKVERTGCCWCSPSDRKGERTGCPWSSPMTAKKDGVVKLTNMYSVLDIQSWLCQRPRWLFVPNPLRCFYYNSFGCTNTSCRSTANCDRCALKKQDGQYDGPQNCSTCSGPHPSLAKECQVLQKEKEI